jgi:hypothetical protein
MRAEKLKLPLDRVLRLMQSTDAYQIAVIYVHREDLNRAFVWLDRAYEERDGTLSSYL